MIVAFKILQEFGSDLVSGHIYDSGIKETQRQTNDSSGRLKDDLIRRIVVRCIHLTDEVKYPTLLIIQI